MSRGWHDACLLDGITWFPLSGKEGWRNLSIMEKAFDVRWGNKLSLRLVGKGSFSDSALGDRRRGAGAEGGGTENKLAHAVSWSVYPGPHLPRRTRGPATAVGGARSGWVSAGPQPGFSLTPSVFTSLHAKHVWFLKNQLFSSNELIHALWTSRWKDRS